MNDLPRYIVKRAGSWAGAEDWNVYELNAARTWYTRDAEGNGYTVENAKKYAHAFIQANTLEEVNNAIRFGKHAVKYGDGRGGDVNCPKCGYGYSFNHHDDNGAPHDTSQGFACICGCKFIASSHVEVKFSTKIL